MAMTVSELQVKVSADTSQAESGLSALGGKLGKVGTGLATAFGGAAIAGVAALAGGLAAATGAAVGFESKMSAVKAVSGATATEMQQLTSLALDLGAKTSFSASEAAQGIEELVKAGVSIGDVMGGAAAASLSLAAAGAVEVKDAAEIAANAMNQFNLKGEDLGRVADLIAGAANASAIDVNDFKFSLAAVGAVANTVGFTFDDTAAAIALMGQAGIKGSDAGTSLKTMLLNLQPATKEQRNLFRELGIVTADGANKFFDAQGKVRGMAEVAGVLQTALEGQTKQQKLATLETIFGSDAIRAAAVFAEAGAAGFNEMAESMSKVTAEAVAAERLNNVKGDLEQLSGALETAGIKIGTAFLPGLRSLIQGSTEVVNQAAPMLETFATDSAAAIQEASTQIRDAWGTAQQAFAGEWLPSDDIPPFVNAVGLAATAAREFGQAIEQVGARANALGSMDALNRGMESLNRNSSGIASNIEGLGAALERLGGSSSSAEQRINLLAAGVRLVAAGFENAVAVTSILVDSLVQAARTFVNFQSVVGNSVQAMAAWATGNEEAYQSFSRAGAEAFVDMIVSTAEWGQRTAESASGVKNALVGVGQAVGVVGSETASGMAEAAGAVETGAAEMAGAMEAGSAAMASATESSMALSTAAVEAGMTTSAAAVETGGAAMAAAAETAGAGMVDGIASQMPAMAAAADAGASGAVAAVSGHEGAASAAGSSLGSALGSGLEGGILAYVGRVAAAAASLVSSAIGAGEVAADAHSPSRKTEQLGKDMAEGLEIGLSSSKLGEEMQAKIRGFIDATREYIPVAAHIASVENEIKTIREKAQTEALFRAEQMIDLDSETLRLKEAAVRLDRDSLDLRHDLAAASREIADAERGSLADRTRTIEMDGQRKALRLQTLDLEKQLVGLDTNSKRARSIQEQIDKLRDQDRLLAIESERIKLTNEVAATGARVRREELDDRVRGYDTVIDAIKRQIETLDAEKAVFVANENVIKNATDNEVAYRERLIAVFKSESAPLQDRIRAGLALVDQLEREGSISKELADKLRATAKEAGAAAGATTGLASSAGEAAPKLDAAASKADRLASEAAEIAKQSAEASRKVDALSSSLGKLPSWFKATGSSNGLFKFADGGRPPVGVPSLVGERGPELFVPDRSGTIIPADVTQSWMGSGGGGGRGSAPQSIRLDIAVGGKVAKQIVIDGYELAVRGGWTPGGLTG